VTGFLLLSFDGYAIWPFYGAEWDFPSKIFTSDAEKVLRKFSILHANFKVFSDEKVLKNRCICFQIIYDNNLRICV
jgi:hypothetical protein